MGRDKPEVRNDPRDPRAQEPFEREHKDEATPTHPVGTAVGGAAGAVAAGAAVGSVAGPVGAAVGAAIGAAAGGMAGAVVADLVDPKMEEAFWRKNWSDRKYIEGGYTYDQDWSPAYRYGVETYNRHPDRHFDELEGDLSSGWSGYRGESRLEWHHARPASLEAWERARSIAAGNLPREDREPDRP